MRFIILLFVLMSCFTHAGSKEPEFEIKRITDNVYQHISYERVEPWGMVSANGLIVIDGSDAHIIDTPWNQKETEKLIKWIQSKGLNVKSSVVTHFHEDSSGGLPFLNNSQIKTYATSMTNELLRLERKETSSIEVSANTFEMVKDTIEIYYPGGGHTRDNIVVWLPKSRILFGGCFVKSIKSKGLGNIEDALVQDWSVSIERVLTKYPDIKLVVPGHGKIGDISLLSHTAQLTVRYEK